VSWTAKHTNDWVMNKAEVSRNLLESVKTRRLTYFGHVVRGNSDSLEKGIIKGTPGSQKRGRPKTTWMETYSSGLAKDRILALKEDGLSPFLDRVRWRQLVHGVPKPWIEDG